MPSNKDLIERAEKLAEELGLEVVTVGLNNNKLSDLVSDLNAKKTDAGKDTGADEAEAKAAADEAEAKAAADEAEAKAAADEAEVVYPYSVAPGKAVTSKRGILSEGEEVKAEYLPGGKDTLDDLVSRKYVVEA